MSPLPWRKIRFFKAFFLRKVLTYLISNCYSCAQYSFIKDCNHRGNSDEARHLPTKLQSSVGRHLLFCVDRLSQYQGLGIGKDRAFYAYEALHHRQTDISCQNSRLLEVVHQFFEARACAYPFKPSCKLVASTFNIDGEAVCCPYLSHTCTVAATLSIFKTGKLLSAVRAFGVTAQELAESERNAAGDPADYFHYVMLGWSNTTSGYRLAMERLLNRMPNEKDLREHFVPGVSFHYSYFDIC